MSLDNIKLSLEARDQLIKLKTKTGIKNWNTLCRWSFCLSLNEDTTPSPIDISTASNVEMDWKTFGGKYHELYLALLKERCHKDGFECADDVLDEQFRLHLHRGIGYLFADKSISDISVLVNKVMA